MEHAPWVVFSLRFWRCSGWELASLSCQMVLFGVDPPSMIAILSQLKQEQQEWDLKFPKNINPGLRNSFWWTKGVKPQKWHFLLKCPPELDSTKSAVDMTKKIKGIERNARKDNPLRYLMHVFFVFFFRAMETTNDQPTLNAKQSPGLGKCIQLNTWMKFYRQLWLIMEPTWALLEHVRTTSRRYFLNTLRLVVRLSMQDKTNFPFIHFHERWLSFISGISWLNINQSPAFKFLPYC